MAANFRIQKSQGSDRLELVLSGHFDGSSAAQLANVLERNHDRYAVIHILTDDMDQVAPFGRQVLRARLMGQPWAASRCRFAGRWAASLQEQVPSHRKAA